MLLPSPCPAPLPLFQKIKGTGEISYIYDTHPTGRVVQLASGLKAYRPEELEPATEEEYLSYMRLRTLVSINYARMMRKQPLLTAEEMERQHPVRTPIGAIRRRQFRQMSW